MSEIQSLAAVMNQAAALSQNSPVQPFTDGEVMNAALAACGEKLGDFKAYDSQLPVPDIEGTRVVKCLYQIATSGPNKGKKVRENAYVRVPCKHLTEELILSRIADLTPYFLTYLQEIEDKQIKETHKNGGLSVHLGGLGLDKLIDYLEETSTSSRLNKEKIAAWYVSNMRDDLAVLFADKLGYGEDVNESELAQLDNVLAAYSAKFESLASPKVHIVDADCKAMIAALKECPNAGESLIGKRFMNRLENMGKKTDSLLLSL